MMTEQEKYEMIEAYLNDSLTPEQRNVFDHWQAEDANAQQEIEVHRELQQALGSSSLNSFRKLSQEVVEENRPSRKLNPFTGRSWWWAAASIAAIVAVSWWILAPSNLNTDRVFSQYYETPTSLGLTRADQPSTPASALQIQERIDSLYQLGAYQEVLSVLKNEGEQLAAFESSDYFYWLGILYLEVDQPEQAIAKLEQVQVGHPDEKNWYLSLALLKSGRLQEAQLLLSNIAATEGPYQKEASQILQDL